MENVSRKIIKHKVGLLNLAKELGNVFQAYRAISITSSGEIFIRRKL